MLSNAQQFSAMLNNAQQCSAMLSNAQPCSVMLSNARQCSAMNELWIFAPKTVNGTIRLSRASHASCGTTGQQGLLNMRFRSLYHVYIFSLQATLKYQIIVHVTFPTFPKLLKKILIIYLHLSNAQQCSTMLSNAKQCSAMLSNAQQCSTMLSNA